MKRNNFLLSILLLMSHFVFPQNEKLISGKIIVKDATVEGVRVINLISEKEVQTNSKGEFAIYANVDDLLVFSAVHLDYMRKIIEAEDFEKIMIIEMTSKINELDEVEVQDFSDINAVNLGILSKPAKAYTPAERRLKTATSLDPAANVGTMMGGSISLDPLMNWISGRTKMLKRELEVEKREILLSKVNSLYEEDFFIETMKIDKEYIEAFKYYIVHDASFASAINLKNKALATFTMGRLANEFNDLRKDEK